MKKFFNYINEIFNTKNYIWIKKTGFENVAKFTCIDTYYIHFDSIGSDAYNVYFYYIDLEGNKIFDLINIDKRNYKVISNVKNCIEDFIKNNNVNFIGYSSNEKERESLYMLMIQNIVRENDKYSTKKVGKKTYYFLYDKDSHLESHLYIQRFLENDNKIKK